MLNKNSFKLLEALRGLSALMVVICHSRELLFIGIKNTQVNLSPHNISFNTLYFVFLLFTKLGPCFVITFFVLSGISIAYSLNHNPVYLKFINRRFIRIYPTYFLGVLWVFFIFYLLQSSQLIQNSNFYLPQKFRNDELNNFFTLKTFINNLYYNGLGHINGQFWSLTYEVIFYALIPIFIKKYKIYLTLSIVLYLTHFFPFLSSYNNIFYNYFFHYNVYFLVGVYLYKNSDYFKYNLYKNNKYILLFPLMILFLTIIFLKIKDVFYFQNELIEILSVCYSILLIKYVLIYNLKNKVLENIGKFSYTLYITHMGTIFFFYFILSRFLEEKSFLSFKYTWIIGVLFTIFIAYILYFLAEGPTKKYLNKLRN